MLSFDSKLVWIVFLKEITVFYLNGKTIFIGMLITANLFIFFYKKGKNYLWNIIQDYLFFHSCNKIRIKLPSLWIWVGFWITCIEIGSGFRWTNFFIVFESDFGLALNKNLSRVKDSTSDVMYWMGVKMKLNCENSLINNLFYYIICKKNTLTHMKN